MYIELIDKIKPKNNGDFALVDSEDVEMPDGTRLSEYKTDGQTIMINNGILSVKTTDAVEQDNTLPITSAGVYATIGNIEALLKTI